MTAAKGRAGRPRMDPAKKMRHLSATVTPETSAAIEAARLPGETIGRVIDRAVEALKERGKI